MNILDLIKNKDGYFFKAHYRQYEDSPPKYFTYKELNNPTERFGNVIFNLINVSGSMVIQTVWDCDFKINGFVTTADGAMWQIQDIQKDYKNSRAVSFLTHSPKREYIIGLIKYDNPKRLK